MQIRKNLSHDIAEAIRERIMDGRLEAGARLNEVRLSEELGVSRTPLREALTRLEGEGFVEQAPRRGFFVKTLNVSEIESLYAIRGILDPRALALAGLPGSDQIEALEGLNRAIERERDPSTIIDLDDRWHLMLLEHCPNPILLELIEQFMFRTRRYEYAYMRKRGNVEVALDEHRRILDALRAGDLDAACEALRRNMQTAPSPLRQTLENRSSRI